MIEMNVFSRDYIDSLYRDFQQDPASLPTEWQTFFETFDPSANGGAAAQLPNVPVAGSNGAAHHSRSSNSAGITAGIAGGAAGVSAGVLSNGVHPSGNGAASGCDDTGSVAKLQDRVDQLIRGFRVRGHLEARIDPLGRPRKQNSELSLASYGLRPADLERQVSARTVEGGNVRSVNDILSLLRETYCRSIGAQFMHIDDRDVREHSDANSDSIDRCGHL